MAKGARPGREPIGKTTEDLDAPSSNVRRQLLKGALGGGVLAAAAQHAAVAQTPPKEPQPKDPRKGIAPAPGGAQELYIPPEEPGLFVSHPNSDVMVDVIRSLGIEYIAANPGSSFRGLHESVINYGANARPELLTCLHEETSVALAAGYARATGKAMAVMMHATVGLQHGAMSIYNAFVDCAPVLMFAGASLDAATRRPYIEWVHAAQDNAATVRDFVKWDDQPVSMQHFAESTVRAAKLALSAPMGPVLIMIDEDLQEKPFEPESRFQIPRFSPSSPPVADGKALEVIAAALVAAQDPVILAHRYARTTEGMARLVALAELLQIPVIDSGDRFNFPTDHPLNQRERMRALVAKADVILALEPVDLWGSLHRLRDQNGRPWRPAMNEQAKVFTIGVGDHFAKSNYQNFQRYQDVTLAAEGDAEASLPGLTDAVRRLLDKSRDQAISARGAALKASFLTSRERAREEARIGWTSSPITTGRLCLELWEVIQKEDWVLASQTNSVSSWPQRLWDMNKPHQYAGIIGAAAVGSSIGTATGIALGHRGSGRVVVNIQSDGDLLYAPGALWTSVHHHIPMLTVVHNNRAYHQELMHIQRMAGRRDRGIERAHIGTEINDPPVKFTHLASAMGMWTAGPIESPADLKPALQRALAVVKAGEPALVEVITQPR